MRRYLELNISDRAVSRNLIFAIMIEIKKSKGLESLAKEAGLKPCAAMKSIINNLVENNIIDDDETCWGLTVAQAINDDSKVSDFVAVLSELGIKNVKSSHYEALSGLILIGPYDCPECGGQLEITDEETEIIAGDGYNSPFEYFSLWEERTCQICGYQETTEPGY